MTHPGFLDQPFIKVPNPHPDESIDFRAGEVIYSNPKAREWVNLGYLATFSTFLYTGVVWPLATLYKTHIPNEVMNNVTHSAYMEFSMYTLDTLGASIYSFPPAMVMYGYILLKLYYMFSKNFVTKIQYNKTKDLVFITSVGELGKEEENVYELANIEHVTPSIKGFQHQLSAMDKGGFMVLKCLEKDEHFYGKRFGVG